MPRKSNVSVSAVSPEESASFRAAAKEDGLSIEDLNLPKSITQRLAKGVLPPNTQIQKDAVLAMSKSATVFVNYLTSQAAENAARNGKKTVMPTDVYDAMQELEFGDMLPRLMAEVAKFTSIQADKRNSYRKKVREVKKAAKDGGYEGDSVMQGSSRSSNVVEEENSSPRAAKRARRESGEQEEDEEDGEDDEEDGEEDVDVDVDADDTVGVREEEEEEEEEESSDVPEDSDEGEEEGLAEDPLEVREEEDDGEESDGSQNEALSD